MAAKKTTPKKDDKAPPPAVLRYALTHTRTTLGDGKEDTVVEEAGDVVKFSRRGVPYATLRVEGDEIVVTFLKPKNLGELEPKLEYYKAAPQSGWLEWRRVASRDPRPGLEAGFGSMIGQTMYEIREGEHSA